MAKNIKQQNGVVNKILEKTFGKGATLEVLNKNTKDSELLQNEYLGMISNTLNKITVEDYIKIKVPFMNHFFRSEDKVGDYKKIRQIMLGTLSEYSSILNVNKHKKAEIKDLTYSTVRRWTVELSLSEDIVAGAMLDNAGLFSFISHYIKAMTHTLNIAWLNYFLDMFVTVPTIYRVQNEVKQEDGESGVLFGKELWKLLARMGMVSDKFNLEGIPQFTSNEEAIIILNSNYKGGLEFDSVGGIFNFGDIEGGKKLRGNYTYDFPDEHTIGVVLTPNSFILEPRLNKSTKQGWARTLIEDNYTHLWFRALRNGFANSVRLVDKDYSETKIDYKKSPFTNYADESKKILKKDEAPIVDVTEFVLGSTLPKVETPLDLEMFLTKGIEITSSSEVPSESEVLKGYLDADFRLEEYKDRLTIKSITSSSALIKGSKPFDNTWEKVRFYIKIEKPKQLKELIKVLDLGNVDPIVEDDGHVEHGVMVQKILDANEGATMYDFKVDSVEFVKDDTTKHWKYDITGMGSYIGSLKGTFESDRDNQEKKWLKK